MVRPCWPPRYFPPNDHAATINEKVDACLAAGVAVVWVIDPHNQTVTVCRPGAAPALFNIKQELTAEPHLSGFRVSVATVFV
jgi:Uma2 family endonuclease